MPFSIFSKRMEKTDNYLRMFLVELDYEISRKIRVP